jgi:hypothetical protein
VDWRTAKRAWLTGWPGFRPIREQVEAEQVRARAALAKEALAAKAAAAPALAQEDAVQAAAREALMARAAREVSLSLLGELAPLRGHVRDLMQRVRSGVPSDMSAGDALDQMKAAVSVVGRVVEIAAAAQRMEHLRVGDPTAIVGVKPLPPGSVSLEEAEAEVEAARRALSRIKSVEVADGRQP